MIVSFRKDIGRLRVFGFSGQIARDVHRCNCVVLQDAPDSASRSDANASRYIADVRTYTRVSSRNSAVHFYYLPFYGRKSLPHADSRCAEGRRAITEGVSVKTSRVRGSLVYLRRRSGDEATYVRTCF